MELCSDLSGVRVGDMLLVSNSGQTWLRAKVTRITATRVEIGEGRSATQYHKKHGRRVGDSGAYTYSNAYLYDGAGQARWRDLVAAGRERNLRKLVREADWHKVPFDSLLDFAGTLLSLDAFSDSSKVIVCDLLKSAESSKD